MSCNNITLDSSKSLERSLSFIREKRAGLSEKRRKLLERIPESGSYASVKPGIVSLDDLAYLCAATDDEIALLRGKHEDVIFHGTNNRCEFSDAISKMLECGKLYLYAHTHPAEEIPIPSPEDRIALKRIGQQKSIVISGITGRQVIYSSSPFDDLSDDDTLKGGRD